MIAPGLYHRTADRLELAHGDAGRQRGLEILGRPTRAQALDDVQAAIDYLRERGSQRLAMIGLSVGGHVAYLAATQLELAAVAVLYGGWLPTTDIPLSEPEPTLALTPVISARVLMLIGETDHVVPPQHRLEIAQALSAANTTLELIEYPAAPQAFSATAATPTGQPQQTTPGDESSSCSPTS